MFSPAKMTLGFIFFALTASGACEAMPMLPETRVNLCLQTFPEFGGLPGYEYHALHLARTFGVTQPQTLWSQFSEDIHAIERSAARLNTLAIDQTALEVKDNVERLAGRMGLAVSDPRIFTYSQGWTEADRLSGGFFMPIAKNPYAAPTTLWFEIEPHPTINQNSWIKPITSYISQSGSKIYLWVALIPFNAAGSVRPGHTLPTHEGLTIDHRSLFNLKGLVRMTHEVFHDYQEKFRSSGQLGISWPKHRIFLSDQQHFPIEEIGAHLQSALVYLFLFRDGEMAKRFPGEDEGTARKGMADSFLKSYAFSRDAFNVYDAIIKSLLRGEGTMQVGVIRRPITSNVVRVCGARATPCIYLPRDPSFFSQGKLSSIAVVDELKRGLEWVEAYRQFLLDNYETFGVSRLSM